MVKSIAVRECLITALQKNEYKLQMEGDCMTKNVQPLGVSNPLSKSSSGLFLDLKTSNFSQCFTPSKLHI